MISRITLAPATEHNVHLALNMLDASAQWLKQKGIHQWQSPLPASFVAFMHEETAARRVWFARAGEDDSPIATFRTADHDLTRWQDDGHDDALYVYALALRQDLHGQGAGAKVIDHIRALAEVRERDWLRLDCWALNPRLRAYYAAQGFSYAGDILDDGFPLSRYQVRIPSGNRPTRGTLN